MPQHQHYPSNFSELYVYVAIASDGNIKVGTTSHPKRRMVQIGFDVSRKTTGLFFQRYPAAEALQREALAHQRLAPYRIVGEWYNCSPQSAIAALTIDEAAWPKADVAT